MNKIILKISATALVVCAAAFTACDNVNVLPPPPPGIDLKEFNPDKIEQLNKDFIVKEARLTPEEQEVILPILFQVKSEKRQLRRDMRGMTRRVEREADISDKDCEKILEQLKQCRDGIAKLNTQLYDELQGKGIPAKKILMVIAADNRFKRATFKSMALKEEKHEEDSVQNR